MAHRKWSTTTVEERRELMRRLARIRWDNATQEDRRLTGRRLAEARRAAKES